MTKWKQTEIGEIPEDWQVLTVENATEKIIDYRGKTPQKTPEGIPLITAKVVKNGHILEPEEFISEKDYEKWMKRGLPKSGDVIITTEAPMGEVAQLDNRKIALAQRIITLRGKRNLLDNNFLRYILQSPILKNELKERETGTTVTGIKQSELRKVLLPIPPYTEQKAIAKVLLSLDNKIELNQKISRTLTSIGHELFKRWFIDFEFPNEKGKPYNSSGGKMVMSELGRIPEGWLVSKLGKELQTVLGGTPPTDKEEYWSGGTVPWINSGKINEFRILEPTAYITKKALDASATKIMPKGTTVIAITGATLGQVSRIESDMCANQSVVGVIESNKIPSEYIYFWIKYNIVKLISSQTGGAQQHINKNNVNSLELLIPSDEITRKFVSFARPLFNQISNSCFESLNLSKTRDSLLPKLMSGKIRVPIGVAK